MTIKKIQYAYIYVCQSGKGIFKREKKYSINN